MTDLVRHRLDLFLPGLLEQRQKEDQLVLVEDGTTLPTLARACFQVAPRNYQPVVLPPSTTLAQGREG